MRQTITFTINPEVKKEAIVILKSEGKTMSAVLGLYLKKIIEENKKNATTNTTN